MILTRGIIKCSVESLEWQLEDERYRYNCHIAEAEERVCPWISSDLVSGIDLERSNRQFFQPRTR